MSLSNSFHNISLIIELFRSENNSLSSLSLPFFPAAFFELLVLSYELRLSAGLLFLDGS
jgi:hypothetical protein